MKEIGGYFELEKNNGAFPYEDSVLLNYGRNCLALLVKEFNIHKIWIPFFVCDAIEEKCKELNVEVNRYNVDRNLCPVIDGIDKTEWIYIVNYYGQLDENFLSELRDDYPNIILDNAQAFFCPPIKGFHTIYTCRKFFGVPEGAILYSDYIDINGMGFQLDRMEVRNIIYHLIGRFETNAYMHFEEYQTIEKMIKRVPILRMSLVTENIMRGLDFDVIAKKREKNYGVLDNVLKKLNGLKLTPQRGPYAYPLYVNNGDHIRKKMIEKKIYVPLLWPNVIERCSSDMLEYEFAQNILPLPCDQRYTEDDMLYVANSVMEMM